MFAGAIVSALIGVAIFGYAPARPRAARDGAANPRGAVLCGYSTDGMNAMAWFLGGALAGLAGVFAAPSKGVSPELGNLHDYRGFRRRGDRRLRLAARRTVRRTHSRRRRDLGCRLRLERNEECRELPACCSLFCCGVPRACFPRRKSAMSSERLRALRRILAPSAVAVSRWRFSASSLDTYWQYVFAISIGAAVIGGALAMLVGYARCITLATGAMMAIGAYGATLPVVHWACRSLAALCSPRWLGRAAGLVLAIPGVRFRSHNLAMVTLRVSGGRDHRAARKQDADRRRRRHPRAAAGDPRLLVRQRCEFPAAVRRAVCACHSADGGSACRTIRQEPARDCVQ